MGGFGEEAGLVAYRVQLIAGVGCLDSFKIINAYSFPP